MGSGNYLSFGSYKMKLKGEFFASRRRRRFYASRRKQSQQAGWTLALGSLINLQFDDLQFTIYVLFNNLAIYKAVANSSLFILNSSFTKGGGA